MPLLPAQQPDKPPIGPAAATPGAVNGDPYHFPDWRADFPTALDWPQRSNGGEYDRTRRQALTRLVANLKGNVRRQVWQMATEFFERAPKDAAPLLIEAVDRALQVQSGDGADVVKNTVEAMGLMADERFDDALRRALEYPSDAVRQAVFSALSRSGKAETVRVTGAHFLQMDGKARHAWLHAARLRLGADAVPFFKSFMVPATPMPIRDEVLKETLEMPAAQAAEVLVGMWSDAAGDFKLIIAGVLHAVGDTRGSVCLRDALTGDDPKRAAMAVHCAARGDLGLLREDVLRLSIHPRAEVRMAVATVVSRLTGEDAVHVLETLSAPGEDWDIKAVALRELNRRGRPDALTPYIDELPTLTGVRLQMTLNLLSASGDARAMQLFKQRFDQAPANEGRAFLQAIGFSGASTAFDTLAEIWLGPEKPVADRGQDGHLLTTLNYIPLLMQNVRGADAPMVAFLARIPPADHVRRARFLEVLGGVAADRTDAADRRRLYEPLRSVLFDKTQLSQLRVLALNLLTNKAIDIDDAMRMRSQQADEEPPMRALFNDFLREFF
jgi:HEAT repeat protein